MANKKLLVAFAIVVTIAVVITLIAVNFQGWGKALAGIGGPASTTIYGGLNTVPTWVSQGGWPSLAVGILIFIVAWPILVAAFVWQKNVP